jgi:Tfp pilus assembly protein PilO
MHPETDKPLTATLVALAVFSAAVLVAASATRFAVKPQWDSLIRNRSLLREARESLDGRSRPDSLKALLNAKWDSLAAKFEALREFDDGKDLPALLRMLVEKANDADIQFVKMQPQTEAAVNKSGAYTLVLEMTASYSSLGRFVTSLEAIPHLVHVDRIGLTAAPKTMLDVKIQLTCSIKGKG